MFENIFLHKEAVPEKLKRYGFQKNHDIQKYCTDILNGEFSLEISIGKNTVPDTKLIDSATNEEYILYKTNATGTFVGEIRAAVTDILQDICEQCYDTVIFKEDQSARLIAYICEKYGNKLEYLWKKFPGNAVWRRKDNEKWYGVLLAVSRRKLGLDSDETAEIIDLRSDPKILESLIDHQRYFPGWHMNKKHWFTIILDGSVPTDEIFQRIDESYLLAK